MFQNKNHKVHFNTQSVYKGHFNIKYKGIKTLKCPFDYVIYQMLIFDLKPDLIIEIGTNEGGSALYYSDIMEMYGGGIIHTIDIENKVNDGLFNTEKIKHFTSGFENYDINNTKPFKKILVIDDGSHIYADVKNVLNKFSNIVSIGSYFIIEDGIIDKLGLKKTYNGGPLKAIDEFLLTNKNYEIDSNYCDMFGKNATFNVSGYLKRIN